ncbi:PucR family transcriptional regulator [Rhodococcus koreensis]
MTDIQQLVDELAERLQQSVAVDNPRGHLIASSKHFGDEDAPRINVVLSRDLDPRVGKYLFGFGIRSATDKVMIPAKDDLGLKARCCYPLRHHRRLLGFIWLIGGGDSDDDIVRPYADRIADVLGLQQEAAEDDSDRLAELGRQLLSPAHDADHAAATLRQRGFASDNTDVQLIAVAQPPHRTRNPSFPTLRTSVPVREWVQTGRAVIEVDLDVAAVLICDPGSGPDTGLDRLLTRLTAHLGEDDVRIGVSDHGYLRDGRTLLRQALLSAYAGHLFAGLGPANSWADIFPHRLLLEMALAFPDSITPPPQMTALFDTTNGILLETAEAYLDHGGDRSATAEALYIHRSTLYYRLSQVQKLTHLDLADGRNRLALHLAIKLQRIADSQLTSLVQTEENRS